MRVLWICNQCIPRIAGPLGFEVGNKEGWLAGLSERLLSDPEKRVTLGICFPMPEGQIIKEMVEGVSAYSFPDDREKPERYDSALEGHFRDIYKDFKPDVIHLFGTEYGHTLAACKACDNPKKLLIGIQGLCSVYAEHYFDGLPDKWIRHKTLRDFLKKDSIREQKAKFELRGKSEIEAIRIAGHVTGRTDWDYEHTARIHEGVRYHFMNETLRSNFYTGSWSYEKCNPFALFVSQGDYPIKGLHFLLRALPEIAKEYPEVKVYVAGNRILGQESLYRRMLISSYGQYLRSLIKEGHIKDRVIFLGSLNAEEMKENYLRANVFVSPSAMENSPNSVGEAMILGMPVVASDVGGVHNLLADKEEGYLYPSTDVNALKEAVCRALAENGSVRQMQMTQKACEHAGKTHDGVINCNTLFTIYRTITEELKDGT